MPTKHATCNTRREQQPVILSAHEALSEVTENMQPTIHLKKPAYIEYIRMCDTDFKKKTKDGFEIIP
jgi:hypothetical protein